MFWSTTLPAVTGTDTLGRTLQDLMEQQRSGSAAAGQAPVAATFRYHPSSERRAANFASFLAKTRASDPQGAEALAKLFASTDLIEAMRAPLAAAGLRIDDVADAYSAWWISAWQASRGVDGDVSRRMGTAVRAQAAQALATSGLLRGISDAAKQEMAEALLIQAALIAAAMEQSQGNPATSQQIAAAVSQGARTMKVDLARMTLTENGFVPAD
jgi:hypothetical protein